MSSFNADKKREHEKAAEKALACNDFAKAFFHTAQAAEFTFCLAEQSEGDLAYAYLEDANELVKIASQLKQKMQDSDQVMQPAAVEVQTDGDESSMRLAYRPKERLSDVSGMEEAKEEVLVKVIAPLKDPDAKKYGLKIGGGLLLYGLPGTGKTFFAKAVAGELGLPFYVFDSSKIMNKYVGESQKAVQLFFDEARKNPLSVIFIDEIDSILMSRNNSDSHETSRQVANIILQEMDGINSADGNAFFMIGATNYPGKIDEAGLSRFSSFIEVTLPDAATRKAILQRDFFGKLDKEISVEEGTLDFLVKQTDGFSCRDLVSLAGKLQAKAYIPKLQTITLEFCKENFVDMHVVSEDVASSIEEFKKRIGISCGNEKKK